MIVGYANLLLAREGLDAEVKEQVEQVYSAGERAANLTRQLLTFSRKKEMQLSLLNLNEVLGEMGRMLGRLLGDDIKLECRFAGDRAPVQADAGMVEQVVMNLAVNARDAMPKGGQLIISTDAVVIEPIDVRTHPESRPGDFVCLSVRDTGYGMAPEIRARIFEPFFTTKGVGKGTGLGLATVFGIVKQHQGWVEVESQLDVGTVFKVFLPMICQPAPAPEIKPAESRTAGGTETVLLVEDEDSVRGLAKLILHRHGYRVLEAISGVDALSVWKQQGTNIDLLLTDMIMPDGLTGHELAKRLLSQKSSLKVIYSSGYSADLAGTAFISRQAPIFLQKPYSPQKLVRTVRECLDRKTS